MNGIQEDAWANLCPESEAERHECLREGSISTVVEEGQSDESVPDLCTSEKSYITNLSSKVFQANEIVPLLRNLNQQQRKIFFKIREWCLKSVNGDTQHPFHVFITGGGGTGKSHLIRCIYYEATFSKNR